MKAVKLTAPGGLDHLRVVDIDDPGPAGPGHIRVRLHATSLNYHDYFVARSPDPKYHGRIPMADGAGVVEEVGPGVRDFEVGDRVVSTFFPTWIDGPPAVIDFSTVPGDGCDGYACETVVRPEAWFTHAPQGWSHAEAATLTTAGLTAWRALVFDGGLQREHTVLAIGTGGVSMFTILFAKALGARVIVTSSSDAKLERARAFGADETINYKTIPEWGAKAVALTEGRGVDQVLELGGPGTIPQSIVAARIGGLISLIGTVTGFAGEIPTAFLMIKQVSLQGLIVGSRRQQQSMVDAIEHMDMRKPVIDKTFPLDGLADAFRYEESGAHFGKICVEF
jgi:NADPH:quinone reductase-like Zn-dependent oxidoreductase